MSRILKVPVSEKDHWAGRRTASAQLVEYGDYECPYCGEAAVIVRQIRAEMKSDLCYVFRNFPIIQLHPHAMNAAQAAEAAALQGKFWEMHELLFERQDDLSYDNLIAYAAELGLDLDQFAIDMGGQDVSRKIISDIDSGVRSSVNGTPTFYIDGHRYDNEWSFATLLDALVGRGSKTKRGA